MHPMKPNLPKAADTPAHTDSVQIALALQAGRNKRVRKLLGRLHPAKVAALLETLPADQQRALWQQVDAVQEGRIQLHLNQVLRAHLAGDATDSMEAAIETAARSPGKGRDAGRPQVSHLELVRLALGQGKLKRVAKVLRDMHAAKVAGLLEALPSEERLAVWSMVDTDRTGRVLTYLHDEILGALARDLDTEDLLAAVQPLELDDLVDLIQALPPDLGMSLTQATSGVRRQQLESMLSYPEDSAGGLMNTDPIAVRADVRVGSVMRYLRLLSQLPPQTDLLMVVDRQGLFQGVLRLSALVTADTGARVADLMQTDVAGVPVDTQDTEVARLFTEQALLSAPVVDAANRLIGRITVDDVVDVIREDSDRALMQMAGLDDEADMFAPVLVGARRRAVWLGINLVTAFLAAAVIGQFEATLTQLVALAVLMPIVASMGGIAGSQTLTLVIRGLAMGQVQAGNVWVLLSREVGISLLNGVGWSVVIALLTVAWFHDWGLGAVLGVAIFVNLLCAALAGWGIPLLLHRLGIDPALAGGVVLTTVTDVVGFFAFLGLATVWLL